MRSYELYLHYKQGDDLAHWLKKSDNVSEALEKWAESFTANARRCLNLARAFRNKNIKPFADTHRISFEGDVELLEKLVQQKLLEVVEFEDEEE